MGLAARGVKPEGSGWKPGGGKRVSPRDQRELTKDFLTRIEVGEVESEDLIQSIRKVNGQANRKIRSRAQETSAVEANRDSQSQLKFDLGDKECV